MRLGALERIMGHEKTGAFFFETPEIDRRLKNTFAFVVHGMGDLVKNEQIQGLRKHLLHP